MVKLNIELPEGFLEPEVRGGYTVTKQSKEIWAVELDMLNELDRVCKKHGLTYFVDSGTLLGAVRDKGYIPWDDDIDVVMMREDYDKLLEIGDSEFKHPYLLQTPYNDKGFLRPHVQIRNSETAAILPNEALKVPFNQGIFLDIFPVDVTSKSRLFNKLKCKLLNFYRRAFGYVYVSEPPKTFKGFIIGKYADKCRKDPAKAYKKFDKLCHFTMFKSDRVDKVTFYKNFKKYRYLEKELFSEVVYLPFEFTKVPVPGGYDEILVRYYGKDYMVPKQQKAIHQRNGDVINSTDESYIKILEKMRQKEK